jgi:predicted phosphodiesterase
MKVAIISDIHGNIHALDAVLEDIQKVGVDQIVVNGDLVNRGPGNSEVMERLSGDEFIITLGNHDALVVNWYDRHPDIPTAWYDDPFWNSTKWSVNQLQASGHLDALRTLPLSYEIALPNAPRVLITHGSPRHYREGYGPFLPADSYFEIIEAFPADIYVGSHTHRPDEREVDGHTFLNSGAVGAPFNGNARAQYMVMTLTNGRWEWEFRGVPYDRAAAIAAYEESGLLPYGDVSGHIFRLELEHALPIYPVFWTWAEKEEKPMNWEAWDEFIGIFGDRLTEPTE